MTTEKPLTAAQSAFLVLLMAEAREVSNTELTLRYGISITGKDSSALVDRKLATSGTAGRARTHELTDDGWAEAKRMMAGGYVKTPGAGPANAALHAVLAAVHRYMERSERSAADIFAPTEAPPASQPKAKPLPKAKPPKAPAAVGKKPDIPRRIREAYKKLKTDSHMWVSLVDLRAKLSTTTDEQVDAALLKMVQDKKIRLIPEENRKAINAAVSAAAIEVGGEDKHLIAIGAA